MNEPRDNYPATPTAPALIGALVGLLALTLLSWSVASLGLGTAGRAGSLAIAVIKASIVAAVFMNLRHRSFTPRFVILLTFSFIVLLCGAIALDVLFR